MALCNTFQTITNTNWIYPPGDLQYTINNTLIPLTATGDTLLFESVSAMADFYDEVYVRTATQQPSGNEGFSLGVGTSLLDLQNQISFKVNNDLYVLWRLTQQLTNQSTLSAGGDSPNGTIGYLTILEDWPVNERPEYYDPVLYAPGPQIPCPGSDPVAERNAKYATLTEAGSARFRRLFALGYV
jgi:hypothetical protein